MHQRCLFHRAAAEPGAWLAVALFLLSGGCQYMPRPQSSTCELQNRALTEQSKAQLAEIANLKAHSRKLEDQLIAAEEDLAALEQNPSAPRGSHAGRTHGLRTHDGVTPASGVSASRTDQHLLAELAQKHPELRYDRQTGLCKFELDVLFPSGEATLDPDARKQLANLARLVADEGDGLHVMIVGHTDDLPIAGREARQRYGDNWHLSTARALSVAEYLQRCGLRESQLGVAGFGRHEPVAENVSDDERQRNRRVEIFLTGPDTPVVGWTKTLPNLYR